MKMFKTLAKVEAHFSQLLLDLEALQVNPGAADLQLATTSIYEFTSHPERLELTQGALIPRAVNAVLSASLSAPLDDARKNPKGYDTQTDMGNETIEFLNLRGVRQYLLDRDPPKDTGYIHLSDAVCSWMPQAITSDNVTIGKMRVLQAIAICSPNGLTQPVIDMCDEKYHHFTDAKNELLRPGHMPHELDKDRRYKMELFTAAELRILELQGCGLLPGTSQLTVVPRAEAA
jgi:hypothetical protein